jgi:hypothetical protein
VYVRKAAAVEVCQGASLLQRRGVLRQFGLQSSGVGLTQAARPHALAGHLEVHRREALRRRGRDGQDDEPHILCVGDLLPVGPTSASASGGLSRQGLHPRAAGGRPGSGSRHTAPPAALARRRPLRRSQ